MKNNTISIFFGNGNSLDIDFTKKTKKIESDIGGSDKVSFQESDLCDALHHQKRKQCFEVSTALKNEILRTHI